MSTELGGRGKVRTAATLPVAEIAPTERLDCRRAFLNILATKEREKESW
jgi:hypothetical protein